MFNTSLFFTIILISIPGIVLMSIQSSKKLFEELENQSTSKSKRSIFILLAILTLILVVAASAIGVFFGKKIGLGDPFLEGILSHKINFSILLEEGLWGVIGGTICGLVWINTYYSIIRPNLDTKTVQISEEMRNTTDLWTRITSGGIVEEVLFRWGLLSLIMWVMSFLGNSLSITFWISIILTGILFGLMHLPANIKNGCKPSLLFVCTAVVGNLWVSIFCGYLFWKFGIISAIIVHILFHLIWYPLDTKMYKKQLKSTQSNFYN